MNFLSDSRRCLDLVLFLVAFHLEGHCSLSQSLGAYSVCLLSVGVPVTPHLQAVILEEFEMAPGTLFFLSLSPHLVHRKKSFIFGPHHWWEYNYISSPLLYLFLFWSTHQVYSRHHRLSPFGGNRFQAFQVVQGKPPTFRLKGRRNHWCLLCLLTSHSAEGWRPTQGSCFLIISFNTFIFLKQIRRD